MAETSYYRHASGAVTVRTVTRPEGAPAPAAPEGAEEITKDEYDDARAVLAEAHAERVAERQRADAETAAEDYEALVAAGVPEGTARRMSGHRPAAEGAAR